ncbi:MAG: DNA replication complex GINS family protein [Candidatus Marsarchaeota archaeon]|nr:DNA replication complex GINS family protein [Candidatus Marsarchaeota archaeon]MCL5413294.1 DNA replication complex GINS family protein [Candidatus Marsarchaeota archaeon]
MENELTINYLNNILKNENKTGEIVSLPRNFYKNIEEKEKTLTKDSDELKNMIKLFDLIKEKRRQKILIYLAYNKEIPRPLPSEEEDLYTQIRIILNKNQGEPKPQKIKFWKSIPEIITSTGNKIGPYEQAEIVLLYNLSDIKFIIDNKLGEIID